jgi:predicted nucleic acid-binding Zn ribbon protein
MYKQWRTQFRREVRERRDESRIRNEDPLALTNILKEFVDLRDWQKGLAEGTLFTEWSSIVGGDISANATPVSLVDGRLTIQTRSTAWATQLNLIKGDLLAQVSSSAPGALVEEIVVIGPHAPSWKRGLRTIRGAQGPRDTYG